jgi:hypothetical protein
METRTAVLRNIAIFFHVFSLIVISTLFFIPNILSPTLKIWCVSVAGASFIGIVAVLIIARKDETTTQYFTLLSVAIAAFFTGVFIGKVDGLFLH